MPSPEPSTTRIVVIGAGFAGTNLVRALAGRLPQGCTLTLMSDERYTTFNPMRPRRWVLRCSLNT